MKKIISLIIGLVLTASIFSQTTEAEETLKAKLKATDSGWKTGGVVNVNFSQAAFSSNWADGTENSMSITSLISIFANFSDGANVWDNTLDLGYGFLKQGSNDLVKSDDKIDLTSKYGRQAFSDWYYAALLNLKSQMTPTYDLAENTISQFLSPGYILGAAGMDWKPMPELSIFISPITLKATMYLNSDHADWYQEGDAVLSDIGGYLRVVYKKEIFTNIGYETKLEMFSNYQEDEERDQKPQNIDILWSNLITMKVNQYVNANFTFDLAHDDNQSRDTQFKEVLGIGISYVF
ncbi:MAG: DUF3078 domain-containing protein [Candidatus Delongbacteria bacterium]|nr:DUF3078 domain-containing protein [Candidatus Delongbacteria bacterium]